MVPRIEPQLLTAVLRGWRNGTRGVKDAKDAILVADCRGVSTVAPAPAFLLNFYKKFRNSSPFWTPKHWNQEDATGDPFGEPRGPL